MFYDLSVEWTSEKELPQTLAFLSELGYNVAALNYTITGKLPTEISCQIPDPLPFAIPSGLTVLRRCTLSLNEGLPNSRLNALGSAYDILALRPIDEKTLQNACSNLDSDLISLDLSQRMGYHFKFKMVSEAIKRGIRFEIAYSQGLVGDAGARRQLISNATQLIRATRGRGIIISSEAKRAIACRAPWDVINLAAIWGLPQDRGFESVSKECRSVVVGAKMKRTSFRGVIDVVYGGERPEAKVEIPSKIGSHAAAGKKRKAGVLDDSAIDAQDKPLSKSARKKLAKAQAQSAAIEAAKQDAPTSVSSKAGG